jgi:hypothetical protein
MGVMIPILPIPPILPILPRGLKLIPHSADTETEGVSFI